MLQALQARIGYQFQDQRLLERALTHSSHADGTRPDQDNERLEFLGDRVLGLLTAEYLIESYPEEREGPLARGLNQLVNRKACAQVARACGLGEALRMSRSEAKSGGRDKTSILGDACEALLGAMYQDGGLPAVRAFYQRFWADIPVTLAADPKTELQEWVQGRGQEIPTYTLASRDGPDHEPVFTVSVTIGTETYKGTGRNKQAAERKAAQAALAGLNHQKDVE